MADLSFIEAVVKVSQTAKQIEAKAQEAHDIIGSILVDLRKLLLLRPCQNCGERPAMEHTPYCEVCRDEMEDRYAEEQRNERTAPWER